MTLLKKVIYIPPDGAHIHSGLDPKSSGVSEHQHLYIERELQSVYDAVLSLQTTIEAVMEQNEILHARIDELEGAIFDEEAD